MSLKIIEEEWSWNNISLWEFVKEKNFPIEWKDFFENENIQEELKIISEKIKESKIIYPPPNLVFRAFTISLEKIKVVILGQDPYHDGAAVGLCFSVPTNRKINPSLQNIYKELENEGYHPNKNGDLSKWAEQGCLLLNTALTVEKSSPESHTGYWVKFTEKLINYISCNTTNIAWILMGKKALEFLPDIKNVENHKVFICSHPSPFSAYKTDGKHPAFFGSGIFKNVNKFLETKKIEW